ncbi:hypothetical protein COCON_G00124770 [Conger conger]|uniref:Uncharacterized protein n=1 Tax=Conger conger TaxID=82655 RepID=A0A9Q1DDJ9_CONCO|nr:hypothetical protein COCON_G00124770 [Conger conger]
MALVTGISQPAGGSAAAEWGALSEPVRELPTPRRSPLCAFCQRSGSCRGTGELLAQ